MTANDIAGYCFESTLWRILCDITTDKAFQQSSSLYPLIEPKNIIINNDSFSISSHAQQCNESDAIWHIGALISYLSSGHPIFGGKGKKYHENHPMTQLPSLRKEHYALTPIVHACLNADKSKQISIEELRKQSLIGYNDSLDREKTRIEQPQKQALTKISLNETWPEEMCPSSINKN